MRHAVKFVLIIISGALLLAAPRGAEARKVHYLGCKDCHKASATVSSVTSVCLDCHGALPSYTLADGTVVPINTQFADVDSSNAMNSAALAGYNAASLNQTSHFWGGSSDDQPAAGAQPPGSSLYISRHAISLGKITCSRCHNPHDMDTNPKLLRVTDAGDAICFECHLPWNQSVNRGLETHPVGVVYNAAAPGFKPAPANIGKGDVRLVNGKVSCTSCHQTHFADSNAATVDGPLNSATLSAGDGKLLRTDGINMGTAQGKSNLCQACHAYKTHGNATEEVGCLGCHSGHSYNGGSPNYFVLRERATTTAFGTVTGLAYNALTTAHGGAKTVAQVWAGATAGDTAGYCERCHGQLTAMPGSTRSHSEGEDCRACHQHNKSGGTYSFEAGGCDGCHGYPPSQNLAGGTPNAGYAVDGAINYSTSGVFKDESATPHSSHAGTGSGYNIACARCHKNNAHDSGTFQDVIIAPADSLTSAGGALTPAYAAGGSGTCSNVYCHSNGGKRTGDGPTRAYTKTQSPAWGGAKNSLIGQPAECSSCHGNSAATMATADKDNSATHVKHLNKGYGCNVCHSQTAASATALAAGAAGGSHVDGSVEVAFDTGYNLGADLLTYNSTLFASGYDGATGNCSAYCHSDGNGNMTNIPDWDAAATGSCVVCHNHDTTDTPMATGSHAAHINDNADGTVEVGWNLGCVECHSNTVTNNTTIGTPSNHINGGKTIGISRDANKATCSNISCHSDGNFDGTLTYKDPTWGTSLGCNGCHGGGGVAYPNYTDGNPGTGLSNSHNVHVGTRGYSCERCHSGTATGSALKTGGTTLHVNQTVDVSSAGFTWNAGGETCNTNLCHGDTSPAWGTQIAADTCTKCHGEQVASPTDAQKAPGGAGVDTNGDSVATDAQVGAHQAHLTSASNYSADIVCTDCHLVPTAVGDAGHIDDVVYNAAELTWSSLANNSGGLSPAYNATTGDCSNTYCHGAQMPKGSNSGNDTVPTWNQTTYLTGSYDNDCNQCHGFPPTDNSYHTSMTVGDGSGCSTCHSHVNDGVDASESGWAGGVFNDPSKHIDGTVEASGCNDCHGVAGGQYWPDGVPASPAYADNQAGAHEVHVLAIAQKMWGLNKAGLLADSVKQKTVCSFCHPDPGGNNHKNDTGNAQRVDVYQDTGAGDYFRKWAYLGGYADDNDAANQAYDYNSATCSNLACHNREVTPADWNTPPSTPDCSICHTANGSGVGRHDTHIGKGYTCNDCHVNNGTFPGGNTNLDHADGTVDLLFNSVGAFENTFGDNVITYGDATPAFGDGDFWTCSSAACHWNVETPTFNTAASGSCATCHGTPSTGKHAKHVGNSTYVPNSCAECHGTNAETGTHAGHLNGGLDEIVTYNSTNLTCTNNCHLTGNSDWTIGGSLACTDCHGSGKVTTPALDRGWPPALGAHGKHVGNFYVAANCVDCHNDNTGGHSALDNAVTAIGGAKVSAYTANNCTNSCHVAADTNDWTAGTRTCTDCHSGTYVGGDPDGAGPINNLPVSGLHAGTLTVSGNTHDDSFQVTRGEAVPSGTCVTCHTATPSTNHIDGTFTNSWNAVAPSINFNANLGFSDGATPTCGPTGAGYVTCHDDGGAWQRKWSTTAKNSDGTECANCHGTFATEFVTGMSRRHQTATSGDAGGQIEANHDDASGTLKCYICHAYGDAAYTAGMHRDGSIQINSNVNLQDNNTVATVYCIGCHTANDNLNDGGHQFEDTQTGDALGYDRWGRALIVGPQADCNSCHAGASPSRNHGDASESTTVHDKHRNSGYVTDQCNLCHAHNGPGTAGDAVHNDGKVDFGGSKWTSPVSYNASAFGGSCTNTCHTAESGEWAADSLAGGATDACTSCHGAGSTLFTLLQGWQATAPVGPTSAKHGAHIGNSAFVPNSCDNCHADNATAGAHTGHKNGTLEISQSATVNKLTSYSGSPNFTCVNTCHIADTVNDWTGAGALACADCHNAGGGYSLNQGAWPPVSNKHTAHIGAAPNAAYGDTVNHSTTTDYEFGCGNCHGTTATNHANGTPDIAVANWTPATKTCGQNGCHQDGKGGPPAESPNWVTGFTAGDICAKCHGNYPSTGAHTSHAVGIHAVDIYTGTTGLAAAGTTNTGSHGNSLYSTTISCNLCHSATVTTSRNRQGSLCTSCHSGDAAATDVAIADKTQHVNGGAAQVVFANVQVKSKAQVRDDITTVAELNGNWTRTGGYKAAGAYDLAKSLLSAGSYSGGSCSNISCHNGYSVDWTAPTGDCLNCHTVLP